MPDCMKKTKTKKDLKESFHTSDLLTERVDHEIEYFAVNLPHSLQNIDRRHFMYLLSLVSHRDLAYLEIPLLQTIITFKWLTYTKSYFMKQFLISLAFSIAFILDIALVSGTTPEYNLDDSPDNYLAVSITLRVICGIYSRDLAWGEARQFYY